jgi:hypothetical protein
MHQQDNIVRDVHTNPEDSVVFQFAQAYAFCVCVRVIRQLAVNSFHRNHVAKQADHRYELDQHLAYDSVSAVDNRRKGVFEL